MGAGEVSRIVADTDALLFWGQSRHLVSLFTNIGITTTNACVHEVSRHAQKGESNRWVPNLRPDEERRKQAAKRVLPFIDRNKQCPPDVSEDDVTINPVFCGTSGLGHEKGGGEESIAKLVLQHLDTVEFIAMMDSGDNEDYLERGGRCLVRSQIPNLDSHGISFVPPPPVLALLAIENIILEEDACSDIASGIEREGWPNTAWRDVPLSCSQGPSFLPDDFG